MVVVTLLICFNLRAGLIQQILKRLGRRFRRPNRRLRRRLPFVLESAIGSGVEDVLRVHALVLGDAVAAVALVEIVSEVRPGDSVLVEAVAVEANYLAIITIQQPREPALVLRELLGGGG